MRTVIPHEGYSAGASPTGHPPTHCSSGSRRATPCLKPSHAHKLTLSPGTTCATRPSLPSTRPPLVLGSHLSTMDSNFISSMRFYSSLVLSELTPPPISCPCSHKYSPSTPSRVHELQAAHRPPPCPQQCPVGLEQSFPRWVNRLPRVEWDCGPPVS